MEPQSQLTAFVFGFTGGAGRSIVNALAVEPRFTSVTLFGRRSIDISKSSKDGTALPGDFSKFKQELINFDKLDEYSEQLQGFHTGFHALGTIPSRGGFEAFKKISHGYTMAVANMAASGGTKHFHWMSGIVANKNSCFAAARLLGQMEDEFCAIEGFERICVYKPATILSDENGGGIAGGNTVKLFRILDRFRLFSVESELLGKYIVDNSVKEGKNRLEVVSNREINRWGKGQRGQAGKRKSGSVKPA